MLPIEIIEVIAGTTLKSTWVSSGAVVTGGYSALISGSESLVNSVAAVDSGNGHLYGIHLIPSSGGWYVNEWGATIGGNLYINRQLVRAHRLEVD